MYSYKFVSDRQQDIEEYKKTYINDKWKCVRNWVYTMAPDESESFVYHLLTQLIFYGISYEYRSPKRLKYVPFRGYIIHNGFFKETEL